MQLKKLFSFIVLISVLLFGCSNELITESSNKESNSKEAVEQRFIQASVVRVVDGDTLIVKLDHKKEERVRLLLIDTPESVHPDKPVQPFGIEASEMVKELMKPGDLIHLELDVSERDKYGRLLAYVWIEDKMVNELLLEKGFARVAYVYAPNTKYVDQFYDIQKQAQERGIGIWSLENYVVDRGFNEEVYLEKDNPSHSDLSCSNPMIKGNHSSRGDFIYHVPEGQYYDQTNAEEMFCTEEEAKAAGYRKSMK
ncbi:thermonuclease family protein [Halalkalibacter krulwichiae]|uniref:Endonuclease YncB n=1 Tax=Halalkalibacter krulwichiae TaxID=199441 RepID=A0A1X9MI09_9BACI|nr:thermonuclease family protein [Halalkalibacter krulwichiae]ARK31241.1 Endonuclease YncB precursor [Halalkalibacter krulwichiae]